MKRLLVFLSVGGVFEIVALFAAKGGVFAWIVDAWIVGLVVVAIARVIARMRTEMKTDLPPSLHGTVLKRRHWRLF